MEKLLKLESSLENIDKLSEMLNESMSTFNYQAIVIRKLEMMKDLGLYEAAIFFVKPYLVQKEIQNKLETDEKLYHLIFQIALLNKDEHLILEAIKKREEVLKVSEKYQAIIDMIEYKKAYHLEYEQEIFSLLSDTISESLKITYLEDLIKTYELEKKYQEILDLCLKYEKIDYSKILFPYLLSTLIHLEKYQEAKEKALLVFDNPVLKKDALLALVEIYAKENDQHKLMVLETENEEYVEKQKESYQLSMYEKLLSFYETIGNKPSITLYKQKLTKVKKVLDKNKLINNKNNEEPLKIEEEKKVLEVVTESSNELKELNSNANSTKKKNGHFVFQFEALHEVLVYSHQLSEKLNLREYLRLLFIKINEFITPMEFVLYLKDSKELFQYKKERLYDKKIIDTWLYETVVDHVLKEKEEIISIPENLKFDKNIITQKPYELEKVKIVYAFPVQNLGVFVVHFDENLLDISMFYDFFKAVSAVIYTKLIDELKENRLRSENIFLNKVINSPLIATRIMMNEVTHFNKEAQELLSVEPHLPLELFLLDMEYHQVNSYKNMIEKLYQNKNEQAEMIYLHQNKQIREKLFSIYDEGEIKIVSIFEDLTKNQEEKDKLLEQATTDYETRILNLNALNAHMKTYIEDKASFILVELQGDYKTIYGYEKTINFYKEFAQVTKKFFKEGMVYRYDDKQLCVYIPQNDIRVTTKIIKSYLKHLSEYSPQSLPYEQFTTIVSALRYPVVTSDKDIFRLYRYLEVTLDLAKRSQQELLFFEYHMYEEEVFEQKVIDYLNIALENKQFTILFNQIIDLEQNVVWQYESEIMLSNLTIDSKYLYKIAKKRNRMFDLEKYHLKLICEFLVELEQKTNKLIKLTIPLTKETFLHPTFNAYFMGLFKSYQIPTEFIRIKVIGSDIKEAHQARINELVDSFVGLDTTNLDAVLNYPFHALHLNYTARDEKAIAYLGTLNALLSKYQIALIIRDVKTKEDREILRKNGIRYIEGTVYKTIDKNQLIEKIKEITNND
ncbi:predicted diguanylate cyclase [Alteracholeplasma palmae J233]|uniref:Predicted diguanylate cyclase n=1 Tax=Alteracholeplasma palmae (strain ATCC 49389 / J233) TaxID=1318466 RepID=U4KKV4_ALTPJ|nr:EAL domain-containing protein [Alteracholeplasma palmae]CCV64313.1 predicted diguanylate cyclase [Alteracholeplasma palmae J233]